MATGVPKTLSRFYNTAIKPGSATEKIILKLYYHYLKVYIILITRWKYRNEYAPVYAFRLIYTEPSKIEKRMTDEHFFSQNDHIFPSIKSGKWHLNTINFSDHRNYTGIKQHFSENRAWRDTELYKSNLNDNSTNMDYQCTTPEELLEQLEKIDNLYKQIEENGYKEQKYVRGDKNMANKVRHIDNQLNEINEVRVNIGPEGELILDDGQHRTAIAKILDLDKIPVRVLVRHRKWQDKRNQAVRDPEKLEDRYREHPDIEYLMN